MFLKKNDLILFIGDSITDMGRRDDPHGLGCGYVYTVASWFTAMYPEMNVRFLNRGISGDRVRDLQARWKQDMLDLNPDVLSVLIGVNDTWRRFDSNDPTSTESFEAAYRDILLQAKGANPELRLILMEPFTVTPPCDDPDLWYSDIDPRLHVVRKLAREFGALFIPLDGIFARACAIQPPEVWAADGIHPDPPGRALIAQAWLRAVGAL